MEAANWLLPGCLPPAEVFGLACIECINSLDESTFKNRESSPTTNQTFLLFLKK